jgi:hypothetical protein
VFDVSYGFHYELNLAAQRFVLLIVHFFLINQIQDDHLTGGHS